MLVGKKKKKSVKNKACFPTYLEKKIKPYQVLDWSCVNTVVRFYLLTLLVDSKESPLERFETVDHILKCLSTQAKILFLLRVGCL